MCMFVSISKVGRYTPLCSGLPCSYLWPCIYGFDTASVKINTLSAHLRGISFWELGQTVLQLSAAESLSFSVSVALHVTFLLLFFSFTLSSVRNVSVHHSSNLTLIPVSFVSVATAVSIVSVSLSLSFVHLSSDKWVLQCRSRTEELNSPTFISQSGISVTILARLFVLLLL